MFVNITATSHTIFTGKNLGLYPIVWRNWCEKRSKNELRFIGGWMGVANGRVNALPIVEYLDVLENRQFGNPPRSSRIAYAPSRMVSHQVGSASSASRSIRNA
jgi:hypothetical protein